MSASFEKTKTPGIYRRGGRYVVRYRDPQGRERKRSAATLAEARTLKAALTADVARGEYRALSRVGFREYADEWIVHYAGRTSRGLREATRRDYRGSLERDAIPHFRDTRLSEIEPRDVKRFAKAVADRGVSRDTVRLALAPVRALFATAVDEGLIRTNPAAGIRIPQVPTPEPDAGEQTKALTEEELERLIAEVPREWRLVIGVLAHSGLRTSELRALRWCDLDFGSRRILVRRSYNAGVFSPPKSRHGRRDVPISAGMTRALWDLRKRTSRKADDDLIFSGESGAPFDRANLLTRILKPAARRAGVPWAGLHTLRHTCATLLFRSGANAKQVQVLLGHHSPAFTLATYVHLLPDDLPEPVEPSYLGELEGGGHKVGTRATETGRSLAAADGAE